MTGGFPGTVYVSKATISSRARVSFFTVEPRDCEAAITFVHAHARISIPSRSKMGRMAAAKYVIAVFLAHISGEYILASI